MSPKEIDTRNKIILVAGELFARQGFSGTSVREIAKKADVNLSAINYHFENKENLYKEVFLHNHNWLSENIERLGEDDDLDIRGFSLTVFKFFITNASAVLNTFKIFLSDEVTIPHDLICKEETHVGPPGHKAFMKKITEAVGEGVPLAARDWAVRSIFSNVVHTGVCYNTPSMKEKSQHYPHLCEENITKSIDIHVKAIIAYLKNNDEKW